MSSSIEALLVSKLFNILDDESSPTTKSHRAKHSTAIAHVIKTQTPIDTPLARSSSTMELMLE